MNNLWLFLCFFLLSAINMAVGIAIGMRVQKAEQAAKAINKVAVLCFPFWWLIEATLIWN